MVSAKSAAQQESAATQKSVTPIRRQGPVGFRTAGSDGPVARQVIRVSADSKGWTLALGVMAIVAGALAFVDDDVTIRVVVVLIGISSITQGVLRVVGNHRSGDVRLSGDVIGVVLCIVGIICLLVPDLGKRGTLVGTVAWFVLVGVDAVRNAPRSRRIWSVLLCVTSFAAAAVLALNADATLTWLSIFVGIALVARGALLVGQAAAMGPARTEAAS